MIVSNRVCIFRNLATFQYRYLMSVGFQDDTASYQIVLVYLVS